MDKKFAFGAIELLLGLLITSIIFVTFIPMIKNVNTKSNDNFDSQSIEEQVNTHVEEIQKIREQTINYNNQVQEP